MGRGVGYRNAFQMLVLYQPPEDEDSGDEWEYFWEHLKELIQDKYDAWDNHKYLDREDFIWMSTDRFNICKGYGGECPCLYLTPREYYDEIKQYDVEYKIDNDARDFFNFLISKYPEDVWGYPTSGYTASTYGKQKNGFQWYGCWDSRTESKLYATPRWFVGLNKQGKYHRTAFQYQVEPTERTHPQYGAVIGPFKTKRAALFCAKFGYHSNLQHVDEYEEAAKKYVPDGAKQMPLFLVTD